MKNIILLIFCLFIKTSFSQVFINGNFENNSATGDLINLSNADCNSKLRDVNSFGTYGDVDIIRSAAYGGSGAQDGTWYLGLTGGGTDIVALTLSAPLAQGKIYTISFYDRKTSGYPVSPIQIGLSTSNNNVGTTIYTCKELPELNVWTQRTFTFTAPNNGQYITVQMQSGDIQHWVNVDNFVFNKTKCGGQLTILASATSVELGSSATFTVQGGSNYNWAANGTLSALTGSVVTATPRSNTTYTVSSEQKGCPALTATVALNIIERIVEKNTDTVIVQEIIKEKEVVKTDIKKHKKLFGKHRVNGRKFIIQESVTVASASIKIMVWDKNRSDGDQVSLYLNGELVVENFTVTKKKKEIILNLDPGKNIIVMHALNLGTIPPNTAALSINDGSKRAKLLTLVSTLKKSGALEVFYDPIAKN
ncbi:MAG: carbohydrate binding domain-containing protein [Bacteroidia bacterium]|nr:carbohydrate binding domain-containing protein [Bacteroidia bacterium]